LGHGRRKRQGWALLTAMLLIYVVAIVGLYAAEIGRQPGA